MNKPVPDITAFKYFVCSVAIRFNSLGSWAMDNQEDKANAILEVTKMTKQKIALSNDKQEKKQIKLFSSVIIVVISENTSWGFDSYKDCGLFRAACTRKFKKLFNIS